MSHMVLRLGRRRGRTWCKTGETEEGDGGRGRWMYKEEGKGSQKMQSHRRASSSKWIFHQQFISSHETLIMTMNMALLLLQDFRSISMSECTFYKFQQWERLMWAKLETQLWLLGLVRFIKIYETANIWITGVLVFFSAIGIPDTHMMCLDLLLAWPHRHFSRTPYRFLWEKELETKRWPDSPHVPPVLTRVHFSLIHLRRLIRGHVINKIWEICLKHPIFFS